MEFDQTMNTNNISTIATFAAIIITAILSYFGYTVDQNELTPVILGVITLAIAIWSSKNPNTLSWLGNSPTVDAEEPVLNDEYECDDNGC
jgi:hypothetical protein